MTQKPSGQQRPVGPQVVTKYCVNCGQILFYTKAEDFIRYQCCGSYTSHERRNYTCFKAPFCEFCSKPENHNCIKWLQRIKRRAPF